MKQFLTLVIAFGFILGFNFWQTNYLKNGREELNQMLDEIIQNVENENFAIANQNVELLNTKWESMHNKWDAFSDHEDVEEVSEFITSLMVYSNRMEKTNTLKECKLIKEKLTHIVDGELVSIATVF